MHAIQLGLRAKKTLLIDDQWTICTTIRHTNQDKQKAASKKNGGFRGYA